MHFVYTHFHQMTTSTSHVPEIKSFKIQQTHQTESTRFVKQRKHIEAAGEADHHFI